MAEKVYDVDVQHHYNGKNWLGSEVGLVKKTVTIPHNYAGAVVENGRKIVKSGTVFVASDVEGSEFPYNGLLESDVDVTDDNAIADLSVGGRYIAENLPAEVASATVTKPIAQGLYAIAEGAVTRPFN